jgi:hypothetical protein
MMDPPLFKLTPDSKAKAGRAAANFGLMAAGFGAAMAYGGIPAVIIAPETMAVLGISTAISTGLGAICGKLAADPPRPDFHILSLPIEPFIPKRRIGKTFEEGHLRTALQDFSLLQGQAQQALTDLLASVERVQGAEARFVRGPTYQLFNHVNSQRETAQRLARNARKLINEATMPRHFIADALPRIFPGSISHSRKNSAQLRSTYLMAQRELRKMTATYGLSHLGMPKQKAFVDSIRLASVPKFSSVIRVKGDRAADNLDAALNKIHSVLSPWRQGLWNAYVEHTT